MRYFCVKIIDGQSIFCTLNESTKDLTPFFVYKNIYLFQGKRTILKQYIFTFI